MSNNIRNIGIFAHIDAGKTTFTERILFESGELSSPGSVEDGTTEMDTLPEEISRGISITASTSQIKYKIKQKTYFINIIDTPGHLDFHSQVDSALLAVDIAILLIDVTSGIRSQTELISKKLIDKNIPILIFLNKIDRSIEVNEIIKNIENLFTIKKVPVFKILGKDDFKFLPLQKEIDEEIELAYIEWSNEWTDKYFKSKDPKKVLLSGLKEGFQNCKLIPIFIGSGLTGIGVRECLQFICSLVPKIEKKHYDAILFKKQIHPYLGRISYIKTYISLKEGDVLFHGEVPYRITHFYSIIPGGVQEVREIDEFSIAAFLSPKGNETDIWQIGDFLWKNPPQEGEKREIGYFPKFGKEFIQILEPEKEKDRLELEEVIRGVVWEDPGLDVTLKSDTGQFQLIGMGELHLDVSIKRLESFLQDRFTKKNLYVASYGLINSKNSNLIWEHHTSDLKYYSFTLELEASKSSTFENTITFVTKVQSMLKFSIESAYHEVLSHAADGTPILGLSIQINKIIPPKIENEHSISLTKVAVVAGIKNLVRNQFKKISSKTNFEILLPHSQVGLVISMLQKRSAKIHGMESLDSNKTIVKGSAASEHLLGFTSAMRNVTQGKASISLLTDFSIDSYSEL